MVGASFMRAGRLWRRGLAWPGVIISLSGDWGTRPMRADICVMEAATIPSALADSLGGASSRARCGVGRLCQRCLRLFGVAYAMPEDLIALDAFAVLTILIVIFRWPN